MSSPNRQPTGRDHPPSGAGGRGSPSHPPPPEPTGSGDQGGPLPLPFGEVFFHSPFLPSVPMTHEGGQPRVGRAADLAPDSIPPENTAGPSRPHRHHRHPPHMPPANFGFFMQVPFFGHQEPRADPEAAAELLRSLPDVPLGLFSRVQRIVVAEQAHEGGVDDEEELGWRCGVCLDGLDDGLREKGETGVKCLPCNHLFHEACLSPWFQTNHTCPTCRLDLDPLDTLKHSEDRMPRFVPPMPFGRPRHGPYGAAPRDPAQPGTHTTEVPADPTATTFTFVWGPPPGQWRTPEAVQPVEPAQTGVPNMESELDVPEQSGQRAATTSNDRLDVETEQTLPGPLRSSPMPMTSPMSRSVSAPGSGTFEPPSSQRSIPRPDGRPGPQRRPHITAVPTLPSFAVRPSQNTERSNDNAPQAPRTPPPQEGSRPRTPPGQISPRPELRVPPSQPLPHFHVVMNWGPPPTGPTPLSGQNQAAPSVPGDQSGVQPPLSRVGIFPFPPQRGTVPPRQRPSPPTTKKVVVRESLDDWVTNREKILGWRCDALDCSCAPTNDEPDIVAGKDQIISIYSPLQFTLNGGEGKEGFELHACEHRWHRACLESTARSCGRWKEGEDEDIEKVWVRCERCRKDGWIEQIEPSIEIA